jgi:hypothetical protein
MLRANRAPPKQFFPQSHEISSDNSLIILLMILLPVLETVDGIITYEQSQA